MLRFLLAAVLLQVLPLFAGSPASGEICDRNGIVLVRYDYSGAEPKREFLFGSLAIHVLDRLPKAAQPGPGQTLTLTLDARIQSAVERELEGVGRGAVVLVNPADGRILALASAPSFLASEVREIIEKDDKRMPLLNRSINSYFPGSAFNSVIALAGASEGRQAERFLCKGGVQHGGRFIKCLGEHGNLDVTQALKLSCNAFFFQYGHATGGDAINRMSKSLGLGKPTGLPLQGESPGTLPSEKWLRDTFYSKEKEPKEPLFLGSSYLGNRLTTPVQMALIAAAIGEGGSLYTPQLIARTPQGAVVQPTLRKNLRQNVSSQSMSMIQQGMLERMRTTGFSQIEGFKTAGICGSSNRHTDGSPETDCFFIGYAPSSEPRLAISLFLQHADASYTCRLAERILRQALAEKLPEPTFREPNRGHLNFVEATNLN